MNFITRRVMPQRCGTLQVVPKPRCWGFPHLSLSPCGTSAQVRRMAEIIDVYAVRWTCGEADCPLKFPNGASDKGETGDEDRAVPKRKKGRLRRDRWR